MIFITAVTSAPRLTLERWGGYSEEPKNLCCGFWGCSWCLCGADTAPMCFDIAQRQGGKASSKRVWTLNLPFRWWHVLEQVSKSLCGNLNQVLFSGGMGWCEAEAAEFRWNQYLPVACSKDSAAAVGADAGIAVRLKGGTLAVSKMLRVQLTKTLLTLVFTDC